MDGGCVAALEVPWAGGTLIGDISSSSTSIGGGQRSKSQAWEWVEQILQETDKKGLENIKFAGTPAKSWKFSCLKNVPKVHKKTKQNKTKQKCHFYTEIVKFDLILTHFKLFLGRGKQGEENIGGNPPCPPPHSTT